MGDPLIRQEDPTPHVVDCVAETLLQAIADARLRVDRDQIILYGSRATAGTWTSESDWDLAIVEPPRATLGKYVPMRTIRGRGKTEVVCIPEEIWKSWDFMGTEIAAALAFSGIPITHPLPDQRQIRFIDVAGAAYRTARKFWGRALHLTESVDWPSGKTSKFFKIDVETYRCKAARSCLLAHAYYGRLRPGPPHAKLAEHWASMSFHERAATMKAGGLSFNLYSAPPDSIVKFW